MYKIKYSNIEIIPFDVWFLENTKDFNDRKLLLGRTKKNTTVFLICKMTKENMF